jgi:hypothetical protein
VVDGLLYKQSNRLGTVYLSPEDSGRRTVIHIAIYLPLLRDTLEWILHLSDPNIGRRSK